MTPEAAATWQAWAGMIQAGGAIIALGVAVIVPIMQQKQERKVRVKVTPVLCWFAQGGLLRLDNTSRRGQ